MPLTFLHLGPEAEVVAIIFFATIFILLIAIGYALRRRVEDKWPELTKRKNEPKNQV